MRLPFFSLSAAVAWAVLGISSPVVASTESAPSALDAAVNWFTSDASLGCFDAWRRQAACAIDYNAQGKPPSLYFGDASGAGPKTDALAVVEYAADPRGNAIDYAIAWFHRDGEGWRFIKRLPDKFGPPRQITVERGRAASR